MDAEKQFRGFATMKRSDHQALCQKAGRASFASGRGHRWSEATDSAKAAGRKGGLVTSARRRAQREQTAGTNQ